MPFEMALVLSPYTKAWGEEHRNWSGERRAGDGLSKKSKPLGNRVVNFTFEEAAHVKPVNQINNATSIFFSTPMEG
ncbi:hypothetical protein V6N12_018057 [Hibiscus sabdariffa]|uniref:Uncharacterized protein n=1 Tax=Hibiscus sabdariffa TaxID=183260 RepID=A0ABR2AQL4_9ROSI